MTLLGWILMIASWSAILTLMIFCLFRVLTPKRSKNG